jgi:hypothetical protein
LSFQRRIGCHDFYTHANVSRMKRMYFKNNYIGKNTIWSLLISFDKIGWSLSCKAFAYNL